MVGMLLVKVVIGLGPQLGRELFQHAGEHVVDGLLLGRVTMPDGNEVRVEAHRETNAADLVTFGDLISLIRDEIRSDCPEESG